MPSDTIDPGVIDAFARDGACCLRGAFEPRWLETLAVGIERNLAEPGPGSEHLRLAPGQGSFFNDYCNWRRIPEFRAFVLESPAAELAARLMGSRTAVFYHEHLLIKEPGALKPTPWHHDQPYYPIDGFQNCSLWLALDPVPLESSLRFVRGSHRWGQWFMPRRFKDSTDYPLSAPGAPPLAPVPDIDGRPDEYEVLSWELEPGDCLAFHMLTLHGAAGNRSTALRRRAFATRWLGDDARFAARPWQVSPPITGGLRPGDPVVCEEFPLLYPRPSATPRHTAR